MIGPEIIDPLLALLRERHGGKLDGVAEEALLDHAFDELGFDGDELDLLAALRSRAAPPSSRPRGSRQRGGRQPAKAKPRPDLDLNQISAPYRFVALPTAIVDADAEARTAGLDSPVKDGYSGTIDVDWRFETPMLIGQGLDEVGPTTLGGKHVIPGATLRGLLRSAVETISHGRLQQTNAHFRFGVRDFQHPLFTDENRPVWDNLGSAWLCRAGDGDPDKAEGDSDYVLIPCAKRTIRIRDLPADLNRGRPTANGAFHKTWLNKEIGERYEAAGMGSGIVDFARTREFGAAGAADAVPGKGFTGVLVFAGKSPTLGNISETDLDAQDQNPRKGDQKKREYVFGDQSLGAPVRLKQAVWEQFQRMNSKPARNRLVADGSWAALQPTLDAGRRIPVFFIGDLNGQTTSTFDMGLTRLFKRPHRRSVADALANARHGSAGEVPDIATALFGHVFEEGDWTPPEQTDDNRPGAARKGRIAVGFAWLSKETPAKPGALIETVMAAPRASYAPFYLAGEKDWSADQPKPAGRKIYPPWFTDPSGAGEQITGTLKSWIGNDNERLKTKLRLLEPLTRDGELSFEGQIRLHNVTAIEVGALLWALTHGGDPAKPARFMIGRAKPAGAGQARVGRVALSLRRLRSPDDAETPAPEAWELPGNGQEGWTDEGGQSLAPFLRAFEDHMRQSVRTWPETPTVKEFLGASSPEVCAEIRRDYMKLGQFKNVRDPVKLTSAPPAGNAPNRLLAAPAVEDVKVPYRRGA